MTQIDRYLAKLILIPPLGTLALAAMLLGRPDRARDA